MRGGSDPVTEGNFFCTRARAAGASSAAPSGGRQRGSSPRRPRGRRLLVEPEPTSRAAHVIASWPPGGVHVEADRYFGALTTLLVFRGTKEK